MIIKILTRKSPSYQNLIQYILKEGKGKELKSPEIITHNLRSKERDIQGYVKEFMQNEALRQYPRKGNIMLYHEILSFSRSDKNEISNEKLVDIARHYIKQRGIEGVYIAALHNEKQHQHIHFATSGTQFRTGKAHRLSREGLRELKLTMQEYHLQKYPEIENSICEYGANKPYKTNKEYYFAQRTNRNTIKQEIQLTINSCYQQAKSQSEFLQLLQEQGLHHYQRKGVPQGIVTHDIKFRFSRLGIDITQLNIDRNVMKKEKDTLDEIQKLREGNTHDREQSLINEAYTLKNETELQTIHQQLDNLYEEKNSIIQQLEHKKDPELSEQLDEVIQKEAQLLSQTEELSLSMEADKNPMPEKEEVAEDRNVEDEIEREEDTDLTDDLEELREDREEEERELEDGIDNEY